VPKNMNVLILKPLGLTRCPFVRSVLPARQTRTKGIIAWPMPHYQMHITSRIFFFFFGGGASTLVYSAAYFVCGPVPPSPGSTPMLSSL